MEEGLWFGGGFARGQDEGVRNNRDEDYWGSRCSLTPH